MALSGNMVTTNKYVVYYVEQIQNWQDIGQNYSNVTIKVWAKRTNSGYTTYGTGTCYVNIDGGAYTSSISTSHKITDTAIVIFNQTVNIWHNSDGSKSFSVGVRISHSVFSSNEQWASFGLTTIPRTSQASMSKTNLHMTEGVVIHTNRASASFTHIIYEDFYLGWWNKIAEGVGDNWTWNRGWDYASRIPNSTSGNGRILVETYSGSTFVGSVVLNFSMYMNDGECVPFFNGTPYYEIIAENGMPSGHVVKNKNRVRVISNPSGSYGSTITSVSVNFWSQKTEWGTNVLSPYPSVSGNHGIPIIATDSRGRQVRHDLGLHIDDWFDPWASVDSVWRCNSDGTDNANGTHIKAHIRGAAPTVGGSWPRHRFWAGIREVGSSTWLHEQYWEDNNSYDLYPFFQGSTDKSYEFSAQILCLGSWWAHSRTIGTAFVTMDLKAGGKGIAFGKVAEKDYTLECNLELDMCGNTFRNWGAGAHLYNGINFDLVRDTGYYVSWANVDTSNWVNAPVKKAGILQVLNWGGDNRLQIFYEYDGQSMWMRMYAEYGSQWGEWCLFPRVGTLGGNRFLPGQVSWLPDWGGEQQINAQNRWTYAFWNASNTGYWDGQHGQVWNFSGGTLYLRPGYQTGSDSRLKHDISYLDNPNERFLSFSDTPMNVDYKKLHSKLKPSVFKMNDDLSEKFHIGFIAQDVNAALVEEGFTDSGIVRESEIRREAPIYDSDGALLKDEVTQTRLSMSYQDIIALNTYMIQETVKENTILNTKLIELTSEVNNLKEEFNALKEIITKPTEPPIEQ